MCLKVSVDSAEARLLPSSHSKVPNKKPGGLSGIGGVLSQLGKKQKISTLEKSKLDWDRFKKEEDIEEELQTYNKGKDGSAYQTTLCVLSTIMFFFLAIWIGKTFWRELT